MTHLRHIMLEELERRNYAPGTIRCYIRVIDRFVNTSIGRLINWAWNTSVSTRQRCCDRRSWHRAR